MTSEREAQLEGVLGSLLRELKVETWGHGSSVMQHAEFLSKNAAASFDARHELGVVVKRARQILAGATYC